MSELNFNFTEVEDFKGRIEPGVEECEITGIKEGESNSGSKYIEMGFITLDKNRTHNERFYVSSEKAVKMTMLRFKHLIKVLKGEEYANKSYNLDQLNSILTGLKGRFLFFGEEYLSGNENGEKEIRVRTNLAFLNFVEPLTIPAEKSKLHYDPTNKNHLKRLPVEVASLVKKKSEETPKIDDEIF
jgi:hypothetical protein